MKRRDQNSRKWRNIWHQCPWSLETVQSHSWTEIPVLHPCTAMFSSDPALTLYGQDKQQTTSSHCTWETYYLKLILPKMGNKFTALVGTQMFQWVWCQNNQTIDPSGPVVKRNETTNGVWCLAIFLCERHPWSETQSRNNRPALSGSHCVLFTLLSRSTYNLIKSINSCAFK